MVNKISIQAQICRKNKDLRWNEAANTATTAVE